MHEYREISAIEKSKRFHTFFFPVAFITVLWLIKLCEVVFSYPLYNFGVYPRSFKGIMGIFTAPFIHGDWGHLFSNSVPLFVLGSGLFYYYRRVAYKIFFLILVSSGLWVWVSARPSYHIGASGIVYGLATFLFVSGVIKKNIQLAAFSLIVVFLYGSLVWGVFPIMPEVSWESHLMGAIAGIVMAIYYKDLGPQKTVYNWEYEQEEEAEQILTEEHNNMDDIAGEISTQNSCKTEKTSNEVQKPITYKYIYKPKEDLE